MAGDAITYAHVPPVAILYDVHGNLPALEAVLADARAAGASSYVLGGDYALFGPWPAETVAALDDLRPATWIRGNVDRWTAHPDDSPADPLIREAIAACREALGMETVQTLDGLPEQLVIDGTRFCHASPISDLDSFGPEPADGEEKLLGGVAERRIVFGHTHLQFRRTGPGGVALVNPGSVGMPLDGDTRAAYGLRHEDDEIELRRVGYDHAASAAAARRNFGDAAWALRTARRLETARL
jgi:diadenosine tetraphosphatase ApaH/serine/threonine PP2A family protein phosphatase